MGGTFNPIHLGHLMIAEEARQAFHLKKVLFVPSYITPNKDVCGATAEQRLAMTRLATADNPYFTVSDMEMRRRGNSYTVDTLRLLKKYTARRTACISSRGPIRSTTCTTGTIRKKSSACASLSVRPGRTARNRSIPSSRPLASWEKTSSNCPCRPWKSLRQNSGAASAWACPSAI